jgi:hypothetical protein
VKMGVHARLSENCWGMTFSKDPQGCLFEKSYVGGQTKSKLETFFKMTARGFTFMTSSPNMASRAGRVGRTFYKMTPRGCILKGSVGSPPRVN